MDATATDALGRAADQQTALLGLVRLCGDGAPRVIELPDAVTLVLGREGDLGTIAVPQRAVSRAHLRVERDRATVRVVDLSSKNGTFVNGLRIREHALQLGDELRLGDTVYRLEGAEFAAIGAAAERAEPLPFGFVGGFRLGLFVGELPLAAASGLHVLVTGESGTGKELAARALHEASGRRGSLQAVNCAAIPAGLFESELFGFRRGSFTGAHRDHPGILRAAHGGTVFLDEIGDMPAEAQGKLLRVLETREVVPIGAARPERVDVRIVGATHRDLPELVRRGEFRGDLYARLSGFTLALPPLRHRKEDLEQLVRHFLAVAGCPGQTTTPGFLAQLATYHWPYNVRELAAAVRRALAVAGDGPLDVCHLPVAVTQPRPESEGGERASGPTKATDGQTTMTKRPSAPELVAALIQHGGNVTALARSLGRDRAQVYRWLREARIDANAYRR